MRGQGLDPKHVSDTFEPWSIRRCITHRSIRAKPESRLSPTALTVDSVCS